MGLFYSHPSSLCFFWLLSYFAVLFDLAWDLVFDSQTRETYQKLGFWWLYEYHVGEEGRSFTRVNPFRQDADRQHILDSLRKARLPE